MNYRSQILPLVAVLFVMAPLFFLIQYITGPSESETATDPNQSITIVEASWGLECNAATAQPSAYKHNNVLDKLRAECDQKSVCVFNNSAAFFGFDSGGAVNEDDIYDPSYYCEKSLTVGYRCFAYDRRREASFTNNSEARIDCTVDASTSQNTQPSDQ